MLYVIICIFFLSIFFLLYGILTFLNTNKIRVERRINQLKELSVVNEEISETESFSKRIIKPFYKSISEGLIRVTPKHKLNNLNKRLERAGFLKNSTTGKWLFNKSIISLAFSSIMGLLSFMVAQNWLKALALGLLVILFMGSLVLLFSSMSKQSVLAGILGVLIMFLPSFISTLLVQELDAVKWLSYLSISQLIRASAYLIFGKPSILELDLFTPEINGGVSIVIMLAITVIAVLLTINNSYREEIE